MSHVLERLESLERRVAALEGGTVVPPPARRAPARPAELAAPPRPPEALSPRVQRIEKTPVALPVPDPAGGTQGRAQVPSAQPLPPAAQAPPPPLAPARDVEAWIGSVLLGRVGIAAVVLAAAYFAQLAYRSVSDSYKVLSLYALAGALVAVGRYLRPRVGDRYVGLLWGGGVAVAYIAGLSATLRYGLVDSWTGLVLLAGAAAAGQALARSLKTEVIAIVSLLAAFAAPFVLDVAASSGPVMLVYAAGVHLWAAWTAQAWGWRTARGVALAGAILLAFAWWTGPNLGNHRDAFLAVHGFAFALLGPDITAAWRGRGLRLGFTLGAAGGLALLELGLLAHELRQVSGLAGGGMLAGGLWLGLSTLISTRAQDEPARRFVRMLATVGGLVAVLGTPLIWRGEGGLLAGTLLSLAALAPLLLFLRRRVGTGDLAVLIAAILALGVVVDRSGWLVRPANLASVPVAWVLLLVALVPAGALVLAGGRALARNAGFAVGAATLGLAFLAPADRLTHAWAAAALVLPAAWALGAHLRARRTQDRALGLTAGVVVLSLSLLWVCTSLALDRPWVWGGALDPHTWSALALGGAALTLRHHGFVRRPGWPADFVKELMAATVALALLAGGREVHLLTGDLSATSRSTALLLFGAAAGVVLALHARTGDRRGRAATALLCLVGAGVAVAVQALNHPLDAAFVWALLGTGLATAVAGEGLLHRKGEHPGPEWLGFAVAPYFALTYAWVASSLGGASQIPHAVVNARFAGGAGLTLLLGVAAWRSLRASAPAALRRTLGGGALVVGYLAGLLELLTGTRELQAAGVLQGAWGPVLVSLYTVLVAGGMLFAGFRWRLAPLRYAALVGLGLVVVKVGLYDLAASGLPLRVLVTGVLGMVLLSGAYAYTQRRKAALANGTAR